MHYYKHHIGDFLKDTSHLTNEQIGVYMRMLWRYYLDESPLPDDCEGIAFACCADEKTVRLLLRHFFTLTDDGWHQARCDHEIQEYHSKSDKARDSANARWEKANALRTHTERNADEPKNDANHKPLTINQEPLEKHVSPDGDMSATPPAKSGRAASPKLSAQDLITRGVDKDVAESFILLRKERRAPVTQTVVDQIEQQARSVNKTLSQALAVCVTRGWQSYRADWDTGAPAQQQAPQAPTYKLRTPRGV